MEELLREKLKEIGHGMMSDAVEENMTGLGSFYCMIADEEPGDPELANCLIEAADRLNETVVNLFNRLHDCDFDATSYRCVIYLFDENINPSMCEDLLFDVFTVLNTKEDGITIDFFDDILRNSSGQDAFEANLRGYLGSLDGPGIDETTLHQEDTLESMNFGREFIDHLKKENEKLLGQLEDSEAQNEQLKERERDITEELLSVKAERDGYGKELSEMRVTVSRSAFSLKLLNEKYVKIQDILEHEEQINRKLYEQVNSVAENASDTDKLEKQCAELRATAARFDNETVKLTEQNETLMSELETVKKEKGALQAKISALEEENASLKDEVNGLRNRKAGNNTEIPSYMLGEDEYFDYPDPEETFEPEYEETIPAYSDFTASIFNDDIKDDYSEEDVIPIVNGKTRAVKNCNIFARLLSGHFEKKFEKKPQAEQNNLIFVKLMEGNYSKEVLTAVKKAIENGSSVSRLELYKMISNKSAENDIMRFCNNAA